MVEIMCVGIEVVNEEGVETGVCVVAHLTLDAADFESRGRRVSQSGVGRAAYLAGGTILGVW